MKEDHFFKDNVLKIALPITIQSLFQASFSVVDQIMAGQLGTVSVAGIGLGGKFSSLFSVIVAAVATAAGILISQYVGSKEEKGVSRSFFLNLFIVFGIAGIFTVLGIVWPERIMSVYSEDNNTVIAAAGYLRILAIGFLPMACSLLISTLLRCEGRAGLPLYASVAAALVNTGLNYLLIFGKAGFPKLGVQGAAWATTISRFTEMFLLLAFLAVVIRKKEFSLHFIVKADKKYKTMFITILIPILTCEFLWSLGENVYAVIYGRIGTSASAAMTLTNPIQSLMIGALTGIASAAGIVIGRKLGKEEYEEAYDCSKRFMWYGLVGSFLLSIVLILICNLYVKIYQVEDEVRNVTRNILIAYAIIVPVKIENMILGGGIIRSGGKTKYIMLIDGFGTWCVGVPLGIITGLVLRMPIYQVYFILSLEECVRLLISIAVFRKKKWMNNLTKQLAYEKLNTQQVNELNNS